MKEVIFLEIYFNFFYISEVELTTLTILVLLKDTRYHVVSFA